MDRQGERRPSGDAHSGKRNGPGLRHECQGLQHRRSSAAAAVHHEAQRRLEARWRQACPKAPRLAASTRDLGARTSTLAAAASRAGLRCAGAGRGAPGYRLAGSPAARPSTPRFRFPHSTEGHARLPQRPDRFHRAQVAHAGLVRTLVSGLWRGHAPAPKQPAPKLRERRKARAARARPRRRTRTRRAALSSARP